MSRRLDIGNHIPLHKFNETLALEYRSSSAFTKTAIEVPVADTDAVVTIQAPFGLQMMRGPFYVVGSSDGSYGAAKTEFEDNHVEVAPSQWQKRATVMAYEASERCRVETWLSDGLHETTVEAQPGDWIVQQPAGEVMVIKPEAFAKRYELAD